MTTKAIILYNKAKHLHHLLQFLSPRERERERESSINTFLYHSLVSTCFLNNTIHYLYISKFEMVIYFLVNCDMRYNVEDKSISGK